MKNPAYYIMNFSARDGTSTSFNEDILSRYDEFVAEEILRHVKEETPKDVMSVFVQRAAEHRVELMQFLEAPGHGPH